MDNRTVRDAYQAAQALGQVPGHRAALQALRLRRDLSEGEDVEEQRMDLVCSLTGVEGVDQLAGVEVDAEQGARIEREVAAFLDDEADTDPEDVREIDLDAFTSSSQFPLGGNGLDALIRAGAVDEDEALSMLEDMEAGDGEGES